MPQPRASSIAAVASHTRPSIQHDRTHRETRSPGNCPRRRWAGDSATSGPCPAADTGQGLRPHDRQNHLASSTLDRDKQQLDDLAEVVPGPGAHQTAAGDQAGDR